MTHRLTEEQHRIIHHPLGAHARVLAVAGSGKSTTLAHRIRYLVEEQGVPPGAIRALMFNHLARKEFTQRLQTCGLPDSLQPEVDTFHSFSYRLIRQMMKLGVLPVLLEFWIGEREEMVWVTVQRAIHNLERAGDIPLETVDPELAVNTIGLWKGALIPPERAGCHSNPHLPRVYAEFERLRLEKLAVTFDDFVPLAVDILHSNCQAYRHWAGSLQHLVIDEYQDINFGQQRLVELLAGEHADVMMVGDDDQVLYEWRGARPEYILHEFGRVFSHKPVLDYQLTRSFRFGERIAQAAGCVISLNRQRVPKTVVAHRASKPGFIHTYDGGYGSNKTLADQALALIEGEHIPPDQIAVLARMYAQLEILEAEFLTRKIPYRVDGQAPFYERSEVRLLLDYIRLARDFDTPMSEQSAGWLQAVINKPFRYLSSRLVDHWTRTAIAQGSSPREMLLRLVNGRSGSLNRGQMRSLEELLCFLDGLYAKTLLSWQAGGDVLRWMLDELDYLAYFQDYYGQGEHAEEKRQAVLNFLTYVACLRLSPLELLDHLAGLDTTQGAPPERQVRFTTIFRTKGLEFDYVLLPECNEGGLPYLMVEKAFIYDTAGGYQEAGLTDRLESERRLFYVAITRARRGVLIGASSQPSRFLAEMQPTQPICA